jgi:hypothetical protein
LSDLTSTSVPLTIPATDADLGSWDGTGGFSWNVADLISPDSDIPVLSTEQGDCLVDDRGALLVVSVSRPVKTEAATNG